MKTTLALVTLLALLAVQPCFAAQAAALADDSKPAVTNAPGQPYPRVDSQRRATFRVSAPDAQKVAVDVRGGAGIFDMTRGADGIWSVTTAPLAPGFHYYCLVINGVCVADPMSESFFGYARMMSGIDVPEAGVDFYDAKPVPHGDVRSKWYYSRVTNAWRQANVYTPPGYDAGNTRYPVLYLQHGAGEDQRGWVVQGRMNFILDNLIASGAARPMIVVMDNGGTGGGGRGRGATPAPGGAPAAAAGAPSAAPAAQPPGAPGAAPAAGRGAGRGPANPIFERIMITELIPLIDSTYRTRAARDSRAMAGLSMGAGQTYQITLNNLDTFAYIGAFSGGGDAAHPAFADAGAFNKKVQLLFVSTGSEEAGLMTRLKDLRSAWDKAGVTHVYYEAPGTAHEWQTWRKSLYGFVPLLFRN